MNAEPSIMLRTGEFLDLPEGLGRKINLFRQKTGERRGFWKGWARQVMTRTFSPGQKKLRRQPVGAMPLRKWTRDPLRHSRYVSSRSMLRTFLKVFVTLEANAILQKSNPPSTPHWGPLELAMYGVFTLFSAVVITQFICRISLSSCSNSVVADPV